MGEVTRPVALPSGAKEALFRVMDVFARTRFGERLLSKSIEVGLTSLGAGNHDYIGDRTGENRLISALGDLLPALVALDVGANRGAWALEVRSQIPQSRIIAVEPGHAAADELRLRTHGDGNVLVIQCAVGDEDGEARLFGTVREGDLASLMPDVLTRTTLAGTDPAAQSEIVQLQTFSSLYSRVMESGFVADGSPITVMKVDTEGFEYSVIQQAMQGALKDQLQVVQFEFNMHAIAQGQMIDDFAGLFGEDFQLFRLAPRFLMPREDLPSNLANYFGFSNWVAVRRGFAPRLSDRYRNATGRMTRDPRWTK